MSDFVVDLHLQSIILHLIFWWISRPLHLQQSDDPGVLIVLESVFDFSLSLPLNYLLESFGGKVLIIQVRCKQKFSFRWTNGYLETVCTCFCINQGMKDPLSKSKQKLAMLRENCNSVVIRELDAGKKDYCF